MCGLKTEDDVAVACAAGADAIGFVHSTSSVRSLPVERIAELAPLATGVATVLVVNDLPVEQAVEAGRRAGVDVVQLHGPKYGRREVEYAVREGLRVWRATSVAHEDELRVGAWGEEALLLDSPVPGSGEVWDLASLSTRPEGRWLLAGGLNPTNVADAIAAVRPWGVDVSSGVEATRGVKNHDLVREFVAVARAAASPTR